MIRQEVTTICDGPHQEDTEAHTIQLAIRLNGDAGFTMVEADYCPEHEAPLAQLVEDMVRQGRPFYAPGLRKAKGQKAQKPTRAQRAVKAAVEKAAAGAACPVEGCDFQRPGEQALRNHIRQAHDMSLEQARGDKLDHHCPAEGCGRQFARAQGLAIHVARKHPELVTTAA